MSQLGEIYAKYGIPPIDENGNLHIVVNGEEWIIPVDDEEIK